MPMLKEHEQRFKKNRNKEVTLAYQCLRQNRITRAQLHWKKANEWWKTSAEQDLQFFTLQLKAENRLDLLSRELPDEPDTEDEIAEREEQQQLREVERGRHQ